MTVYNQLAYLDNAATTPMPDAVLEVIDNYYQKQKVNVHRGMYMLANEVTKQYEQVRQQVADFIHAPDVADIVFTSGATDALNLVAFGYGMTHLHAGDEIIISVMEHHSNLVPWQQVAKITGSKLRVVDITTDGRIDMMALQKMLNKHTKIVSLTLVSNVLGTYTDMHPIAKIVHEAGAVLLVDAAQAVAHIPIDVQAMAADFLAFSGHKMFGPTGVGVLYGRADLLAETNPTRFGGEMIDQVTKTTATFQPAPLKFEAGTPNIAGVLGLGAAIKYIYQKGYQTIAQIDHELIDHLMAGLAQIPLVTVYGSPIASDHQGVVSFNVDNVHAHDVATILDSAGVAVRSGHHCAEPLMNFLGTESVVRVSVSFENKLSEIDKLLAGVRQVKELLT
ncbi:aminotransferase class V-fold PLP-dependent enzyme [Weissella paramesenteroides]|jgi:cysteine desulfurase/selenocysteine lyase|uniref:aminotransferase class V-fold PLP-dependent enzyme n=1 Tax=Weissella paramesenteroides TaxID=1249 RepID=UPI002E7B69EE|nr:cysteine desulfurase [Weissella paramesenteroides]WPQ67857.1 cysteine desulfurase [Weissella paramesenteroides]